MNNLFKYLGVIILLLGVIILVIPALTQAVNNTILLIGLATIILGFLAHIVLNRRVE
jgi:uncharacterized membrane protein HdeD (DUF308 family)